jgi:hypothetical protein
MKHAILITLAWVLPVLVFSEASRAILMNQPYSAEWKQRFYATLYVPETFLRGGVIGLTLAALLNRKRAIGALMGACSFLLAGCFLMIVVYWVASPSGLLYACGNGFEFSVSLMLLVWYINAPSMRYQQRH